MGKEVTYLHCNIGNVTIGRGWPIAVQSMCNTLTSDVEASIAQCVALHNAGCDIIRLTTQGLKEVEALGAIKAALRSRGITTPLVADVHFSYKVALAAAAGIADKVRINPGNFSKDHTVAMEKFGELIDICKEYGTALRIGLNHGSLGERITSRWGDTPLGMVRAVMEWLEVCVRKEFFNVTVSLKSSNTIVMTEAYRLLSETMATELGMVFPLHLGVTEAGGGTTGRIKSAVGIGTLLGEGIGETIRVSLTENPVNEVPVGRKLRNLAANFSDNKSVIPTEIHSDTLEDFIIEASYAIGPHLLKGGDADFPLKGYVAGKELSPEVMDDFRSDLLQACRRRFAKPEYIACPSCGRTQFDIEKLLDKITRRTSQFAGIKIAVMGCIVNGPGEMADADFGYVGEGNGKVTLYKGKEPVQRGISEDNGVEKLVELIEKELSAKES
ncbi:MAG: (E)-4-hydroxy-3-methylbut-2-enyl-diphosphate synthase [Bacteroidales bacterium]|nr:(E)-4-hydroxy-3-methylbut-2-enyl-diphosphate synthase [Bacteroidales bacterium]